MRIPTPFRLAVPLCLILALAGCGMSDRGGPWWEPQEHTVELEPGQTAKTVSLPAGDYLTLILPLRLDEPVSEDLDYSPRLMHYAGFRHTPASKRELSLGRNGKFTFSFITRDPGKGEIVIYRLGPDKKPVKNEPYARISLVITEE